MRVLQDLRQPDKWRHFKKMVRRYARDIANRAQKVDIQALALDWDVVGADMSYWQGEIKDPVKLAGMVDFLILRAGYGNDYVDPRLDEYRNVCHEHNIPFGIYWYDKPGKNFEKHAQNFATQYLLDGGQLPPTHDREETGGLAKTPLESWWFKTTNIFNNIVKLEYKDEMTYTSPGFLNIAIALTNWMKRTLLFVAHWTLAAQPIIPNEWAIPGFTWTFWQWSNTGKGSDYGVSSRYIDLVRYNGSKDKFRQQFGISVPEPPPEPPPPPPANGDEMKYKVLVDGLKIRSAPSTAGAIVGSRSLNEVVIPLETKGDTAYPGAYWVKDAKGWSAAQFYSPTRELMRSFV